MCSPASVAFMKANNSSEATRLLQLLRIVLYFLGALTLITTQNFQVSPPITKFNLSKSLVGNKELILYQSQR